MYRLALRAAMLSYFPLMMVGLGLATRTGQEVFRGLAFVPAGSFVALSAVSSLLRMRVPRPPRDVGLWVLYSYVLVYSLLYFPRASGGLARLGTTPTLMVHVAFWTIAYRAYRSRASYFRDLFASLTIGFGFGFLNALAYAGFRWDPGLLHDIALESAMVRSDLDVPLLALAPIALMFVSFIGAGRGAAAWSPIRIGTSFVVGTVAVAALLLYSRRAPLLCVPVMLALAVRPQRVLRPLLVFIVALPMLPLVWETLTPILLAIAESGLADQLLARNNPEDYLTATGRVTSWAMGFAFMTNVRPNHLIGYGGAPLDLVLEGNVHMHSMVLDVFFDAGFISLGLALLLILLTLRRLSHVIRSGSAPLELVALLPLTVAWLMLSAIEPTLQSFFIPHLMFLMIAVSVQQYFTETTGVGRG